MVCVPHRLTEPTTQGKGLRPLFYKMVIYLTHPVHGTKVAISDAEAKHDLLLGWLPYNPHTPVEAAPVKTPDGRLKENRRKPVEGASNGISGLNHPWIAPTDRCAGRGRSPFCRNFCRCPDGNESDARFVEHRAPDDLQHHRPSVHLAIRSDHADPWTNRRLRWSSPRCAG